MKLFNELSVKLGLTRKPTLADLLAKVAAATSTSEAGDVKTVATPFFSKVVESASSQRDKKFLDVLSEVSGPVDVSKFPEFPSPECLTPDEVYDPSALDETRFLHAEQCAWCRTMLSAAQPTQQEFQELMAKLRKRAHTEARAGRSASGS